MDRSSNRKEIRPCRDRMVWFLTSEDNSPQPMLPSGQPRREDARKPANLSPGFVLNKRVSIDPIIFLLFSLICAAGMWSYWNRLTADVHRQTSGTTALQRRFLTDLYPRWYGARELLLHHRDPYGTEVSRELQISFYGRPLDPARPGEPRDQERFAYPLYVVFLLAPFVNMDFHTVRIIFWWLLVMATIGSAFLWRRCLSLSLSWAAFGTVLTLLLGNIGVVQGLSILQLGLLVSFFLSAAVAFAISGQLFVAGAFLALSTIKPQLAVLPTVWFVFWVMSEFRRRRSLLGGFVATLGVLVVGSEYLVPGWLWRYPDALRSYAGYFDASSLLGVLIHTPVRWLIAILAFSIAAEFWWKARRRPARCISFAISLCFALTLTVTIVPAVVGPFNHVLLLPVLLLLIRHWNDIWRSNALSRFAVMTFCGCGLLPWILALILTLSPSAVHRSWPAYLWLAPLSASLALPPAAFGMLVQMRRLAAGSQSLDRTASFRQFPE